MKIEESNELDRAPVERKVSHLEDDILAALYQTVVLLGGDAGILGLIGSWKDSLPDADVLDGICYWNEQYMKEIRGRIEHYEMTCRHYSCIQVGETGTLGQEQKP
jgi:hypothetical protein